MTPDKLNLEAGEIEKSLSYREFELSRVKYCYIENDSKGNENCFELEGSSDRRSTVLHKWLPVLHKWLPVLEWYILVVMNHAGIDLL